MYNVEDRRKVKREGYIGLNGVVMGERLYDFVEDKFTNIRVVENNSDLNEMSIRLSEEDVDIWKEFIGVIKEFDQFLRNK